MTAQNSKASEEQYTPTLDLVKERLETIDDLIKKFKGLPKVQESLQGAKAALLESEEEIMSYYDLTDLAKSKLN